MSISRQELGRENRGRRLTERLTMEWGRDSRMLHLVMNRGCVRGRMKSVLGGTRRLKNYGWNEHADTA